MSVWQVRSFLRTAAGFDSCAVLTRCRSYVSERMHPIKPRPTRTTRSLYTCTSYPPLPQGPALPCSSASHAGGSLAASGILTPKFSSVCITRGKFKKAGKKNYNQKQKEDETDSEDESEDEDDMKLESGTDFREIKARVPSLRMDAVLKAGSNMSRNKAEKAFYASKIRVNGKKLLKKSHQCNEGDEIDVFKEVSKENSKYIYVTRVVIVTVGAMDEEDDKMTVKLRRYPKLMVEAYKDFKAPVEDE